MESDKADMDVESFENGFLGAIVIQEGGVANVGAPIAYIATSEAEIEAAKTKAGQAGSNAAPAAVHPPPFLARTPSTLSPPPNWPERYTATRKTKPGVGV